MELLNLFDEIDGRLTRASIHCPDLMPKIMGVQKHVRHALNNYNEVNWNEVANATLGRVTALMVIHSELEDDLHPVIDKLRDELG